MQHWTGIFRRLAFIAAVGVLIVGASTSANELDRHAFRHGGGTSEEIRALADFDWGRTMADYGWGRALGDFNWGRAMADFGWTFR